MPLNWRTAQHQIDLIITIPKPSQVLNTPERSLAICNRRIHVMLFAMLIHTEALKSQVSAGAIMRLHGPGQEERGFHVEVLNTVFHDGEFDGDDARHFDGAAEGNLPVALREVEVADAEFGAGNVDGEEGA